MGKHAPVARRSARCAPHRRDGGPGPCELLRALRVEPGLLVPAGGAEVRAFRLTLPVGMGTRRGAEETGFIRSVDTVVDRFLNEVVRGLKPAE